jgi:hypothetical protein
MVILDSLLLAVSLRKFSCIKPVFQFSGVSASQCRQFWRWCFSLINMISLTCVLVQFDYNGSRRAVAAQLCDRASSLISSALSPTHFFKHCMCLGDRVWNCFTVESSHYVWVTDIRARGLVRYTWEGTFVAHDNKWLWKEISIQGASRL